MQQTRRLMLEYLKERGEATVDELAKVLSLTPVTVRHHLDILRSEDLVASPIVRHRATPGRPQFVYTLTKQAGAFFPNNYDELALRLIEEVKATSAQETVNVLFEGIGDRVAAHAPQPGPSATMEERLEMAVNFLNERGYAARWEADGDEGYMFHTCSCPYEALAPQHPELCNMDQSIVTSLLGVTAQRISRVRDGASTCAYRIQAM